ncbi:MAG: RluA family pseudouridine synthase [Clostridia bacterium]|nr:RluA family pseudouridine synthase [Clostridia bacterium]
MREFTINSNDSGQRLDKFVSKTVWGLPLSLMYKFIRKKRIKVNGRRAEEKMALKEGDVVEMYIPDEFFDNKPEKNTDELSRVKPKLDVVYEDENIIILNKAPGVLSHTGDEGDRNEAGAERETLLFHVKCYLFQKGEWDPDAENSFAPSLCNRIDRNTGGLVIAAKNAASLREMNAVIKDRKITKKYLAAVHGRMKSSHETLSAYLFKNSKTNTVRVTDEYVPGSKKIVTEYKVLSRNEELDLTLCEITLHTGRTHQIRAHMAHIGAPLLGDGKYAENKRDRELGFKYQSLWSYKVAFHVEDGTLSYLDGKEFTAPSDSIRFLTLFPGEKIAK